MEPFAVATRVRPLPTAPDKDNPNQVFAIGDRFGLFVYFEKLGDSAQFPLKELVLHIEGISQLREAWKMYIFIDFIRASEYNIFDSF